MARGRARKRSGRPERTRGRREGEEDKSPALARTAAQRRCTSSYASSTSQLCSLRHSRNRTRSSTISAPSPDSPPTRSLPSVGFHAPDGSHRLQPHESLTCKSVCEESVSEGAGERSARGRGRRTHVWLLVRARHAQPPRALAQLVEERPQLGRRLDEVQRERDDDEVVRLDRRVVALSGTGRLARARARRRRRREQPCCDVGERQLGAGEAGARAVCGRRERVGRDDRELGCGQGRLCRGTSWSSDGSLRKLAGRRDEGRARRG